MGAARNPAAGEDSDSDEDEEAIRLLHQHLFQYLEGRLDPRAQMSQLQSNMAGERAQNKRTQLGPESLDLLAMYVPDLVLRQFSSGLDGRKLVLG